MYTKNIIIFGLTYAGIALGGIPGLALDRTGIALLGAIAFVASGALTPLAAAQSVDLSTIFLLYALMVVSAQFRLGGFYTEVARRLTAYVRRPRVFLFWTMCASAALSAVLANDIVCLAFTPVLCVTLAHEGYDPVPFLIGLAVSSNIGSAMTVIGNPQNMLIGQVGNVSFVKFFLFSAPPSIAALLCSYMIIDMIYKKRFIQKEPLNIAVEQGPAYNRHQSRKAFVFTLILIVLFFTPIPRALSAMVIAGMLLCSRRMETQKLLGLVDWHLITLFCGLFIVIAGIEVTGLPARAVSWMMLHNIHVQNYYVLSGITVLLSNLVSNVPAVMMLVRVLPPSDPVAWYVLACASTFAGNLITIGSLANLITIEGAKSCGVKISFLEHARVGVLVTCVSIFLLFVWVSAAASFFRAG